MAYVQQIFFALSLGVAGWFIAQRVRFIRKNIALGKSEPVAGPTGERWKNVVLVAFGQKKMFKRFLPAFFHLLIYVGFMVINLEVLEFVIDGLAGTHRFFAPYLGSVYPILM
ncbi:MAG: Fe-S oxidoreductase, partial [Cyclobacteriaceae bacterium]